MYLPQQLRHICVYPNGEILKKNTGITHVECNERHMAQRDESMANACMYICICVHQCES